MSAFPNQLDHKTASDFYHEIKKLNADDSVKTIKLGNIDKVGLSCLQILMAVQIKRQKDDLDFNLEVSETLENAICDLGLNSFFPNLKRSD